MEGYSLRASASVVTTCLIMLLFGACSGKRSVDGSIVRFAECYIPSGLAGGSAVLLLDDERMEISGNGAIYERRLVKKILKMGSPEEGVFRFGTNKSWKITEIEARALYPDGREKSISRDEIAVVPDSEDYILYSDQKSHSFRFPGLVPGTIIEIYIKRKIDNLVYWQPAFFQSDIPIITKRYTLIHPEDLDFTVHAFLMPEIPDSSYSMPRGKKKIVWELHDIEPFEPEERMPPGPEYHPALWFFARGRIKLHKDLDLESWNGVAEWYRDISDEYIETGPALRSVLDTLLTEGMTEREAAERILGWVQRHLRYVAINLGEDGFSPHDTEATISNRYGDCKDMSVVLASALREVGIESHLVLVRTADLGHAPGNSPSPRHFNHVIVLSVVEGDTLYLDPTCGTCGFGILPDGDQDAEALVIREGENRPIILPAGRPCPNVWDISIDAVVDGAGNAAMAAKMTFGGHFSAAARRALLYRAGRTRREIVEDMLEPAAPAFSIEELSIRGENTGTDSLVITAEGSVHGMLDAKKRRVFLKLMSGPLISGLSDCADRRYPISLGTPCSLGYEITFTMPEEWRAVAAPLTGHIGNDVFDYRYSLIFGGRDVRFSRRWSNGSRIAPPDACGNIRDDLDKIIGIEKTTILVERK